MSKSKEQALLDLFFLTGNIHLYLAAKAAGEAARGGDQNRGDRDPHR